MSALALLASISRLHIVAIAAMGTFTMGWLFTGRYPWLAAVVAALDWFLVNLLNRVADLREDEANAITGTAFVARHRRAIVVTGVLVLVGSLAGVHLVAPALLPLRLAYHLLGFGYNWPVFPGRRRLKQLYFFKNTASATGFLITVFGYPLAVAAAAPGGHQFPGGTSWLTLLLTAGFFFLFELSYEVIYDLRDVEGDRAAGVRTYPAVHGTRVAVGIADGLIAVSTAILVAGFALGRVPWRIAVMGVAPVVQLVYYKRALGRGIRSADCIALTWIGAGLLLAYHVWVKAGLPGV